MQKLKQFQKDQKKEAKGQYKHGLIYFNEKDDDDIGHEISQGGLVYEKILKKINASGKIAKQEKDNFKKNISHHGTTPEKTEQILKNCDKVYVYGHHGLSSNNKPLKVRERRIGDFNFNQISKSITSGLKSNHGKIEIKFLSCHTGQGLNINNLSMNNKNTDEEFRNAIIKGTDNDQYSKSMITELRHDIKQQLSHKSNNITLKGANGACFLHKDKLGKISINVHENATYLDNAEQNDIHRNLIDLQPSGRKFIKR